jgi:hypothetical protein
VEQLTEALQAVGVLSIPLTARQELLDLQGFLDAALGDFLHMTGMEPFLKESANSVRRYDPPGPYYRNRFWSVGGGKLLLTMRPPYQSIAEVKVYDDIDAEGGTVLVEDTDYVLEPVNRQEHTQITAVRFRMAVVGPRHSVKITGKCGYYDTNIPEEIWQAVLSGAAAQVLTHMREGIMGNPTDWREGDSAEKYNVDTLLKLGNTHEARYQAAIAQHRDILI